MRHPLLNGIGSLFVVAALVGCQPYIEPEPIGSTTPIFGATASINGQQINYAVDGVSFEAESFQTTDSLSMNVYSGRIAAFGCVDQTCGPQFKLDIRGAGNIDNTVLTRPYDIRDISKNTSSLSNYTITLNPTTLGNPIECSWKIDDGAIVKTNGSEALILERTSSDTSRIKVELTATFPGNCTSSIVDWVYLPHHGCDSKIDVTKLSTPEHLLFSAKTFDVYNSKYRWDFESGPMSASEEVEYFFNFVPNDGVESLQLTTNSNGCEVIHNRNQVISDSLAGCNVNLAYEIETKLTQVREVGPDPMTVILTWVDEEGRSFRSENVSQPSWSFFHVEDVSNHTEPILGSKAVAKGILVRCAMLLADDSGETVELRDAEVRIPVGSL